MTYPQQPYGQQPGQYGGYPQQGGQYGGYPQQDNQYGGFGQAPQYGGFPGGPYGGGHGTPPPKKSNTGMVIAIVAAVLVLGGLGITGFVAPGFFLGDEKDASASGGSPSTSATNGSTASSRAATTTSARNRPGSLGGGDDSSSSSGSGGGSAEELVDAFVKAMNDQDRTALRAMACADATSSVTTKIDDIQMVTRVETVRVEEVSATRAKAILNVTVEQNAPRPYAGTVVKNGADWCVRDIVKEG